MKIAITDLPAASPYERGRRHGRTLREAVHGHLAAWLASLAEAGVGEPTAYVKRMLRETNFQDATRTHTPDLMEELAGISEGAGVPQEMLFALQLLDEEWAYRARSRISPSKLEKCSSLAIVSEHGPTWIAQNMDLGGYTDGWQSLLRLGQDIRAPEALVLSMAGFLGLLGTNAAGVSVCVNSLPQLPAAGEGVPVAFVVRRVLQCVDLREASEVILKIPHATHQHYMVAEAGAFRSFEASSAGVSEYYPLKRDRVLHTNHPLTAVEAAPEAKRARENTHVRLKSLESRLSDGEPTLEKIADALSSFDDPLNPVCRLRAPDSGIIGFTTGSMISALRASPADIECWISAGPPSIGGFSDFRLKALA